MTKQQWGKIRYFSPTENFGDPTKMSFILVKKLDALRQYCEFPIIIHCGYARSGHSQHSQHYYGRAVDCDCDKLSLLDFYLAAERFGFGGIGLYDKRAWYIPGLHLDIRQINPYQPAPRWAKIGETYIPLTAEYIRNVKE